MATAQHCAEIDGSMMANVDAASDPGAWVSYPDLITAQFGTVIRDGIVALGDVVVAMRH